MPPTTKPSGPDADEELKPDWVADVLAAARKALGDRYRFDLVNTDEAPGKLQ